MVIHQDLFGPALGHIVAPSLVLGPRHQGRPPKRRSTRYDMPLAPAPPDPNEEQTAQLSRSCPGETSWTACVDLNTLWTTKSKTSLQSVISTQTSSSTVLPVQ